MPNQNIHLEETLSQYFDIGPGLYFMKCRQIYNHGKIAKIFPFVGMKIKLGPISKC